MKAAVGNHQSAQILSNNVVSSLTVMSSVESSIESVKQNKKKCAKVKDIKKRLGLKKDPYEHCNNKYKPVPTLLIDDYWACCTAGRDQTTHYTS